MRDNYDVLVFDPESDNLESEGLCGPLTPLSCVCIEAAGDEYRIEMEHPYDSAGRWETLLPGRWLRAWVLMRTPPELDELGARITSVEVWMVAATATKPNRYLYKLSASGRKDKKLKLLAAGTQVVVVSRPATGRWKVRCAAGAGWMESAGLEVVRQSVPVPDAVDGLESVLPGAQIRPQYFEIDAVERGMESVTVTAKHISYQLMKNITSYANSGSVSLIVAAQALLANCLDEHDFHIYSNVGDTRLNVSWVRENPIAAIMDPETGLLGRWPGTELLRDNWDLYVLDHVGVDRGVVLELGKNLTGVTLSEDVSNVATYIMPVGENEAGQDVLLPERWLVSPHADEYPQKHIYVFRAENAKISGDDTAALVYARMRQQAQALLDGGCDRPVVSLQVEVSQVDSIEGARIVELLEPLLVYDTVQVYAGQRGVSGRLKIVRREWDCVHGKVLAIEAGSLSATMGSTAVASWQIPGGISGGKIADGTLSGLALADGTLMARHIQAGSINAQAIAAGAVTADKLAAGAVSAQAIQAVAAELNSVTAQTVSTNQLAAGLASLFAIIANNISARQITADALDAVIESVVTLTAGSAEFDAATVTHLLASLLQVTRLYGTYARIDNLYVTEANIVNATLERICVRGTDGEYYDLSVDSAGQIAATQREVDPAEAAGGETLDGRGIVESELDVEALDGLYLRNAQTGLATLYTEAMDTGKLTAVEAFIGSARIPQLQATVVEAIGNSMTFSANQVIQLLVGVADGVRTWFTFGTDGLRTRRRNDDGTYASKWSTLVGDDGYYIDHEDVPGHVGAFYKERFEARSVRLMRGLTATLIARPTSAGGWAWYDEG